MTQTSKQRKAAKRHQVNVWFGEDDMKRIVALSDLWGMVLTRDVLREALKRAVETVDGSKK